MAPQTCLRAEAAPVQHLQGGFEGRAQLLFLSSSLPFPLGGRHTAGPLLGARRREASAVAWQHLGHAVVLVYAQRNMSFVMLTNIGNRLHNRHRAFQLPGQPRPRCTATHCGRLTATKWPRAKEKLPVP